MVKRFGFRLREALAMDAYEKMFYLGLMLAEGGEEDGN